MGVDWKHQYNLKKRVMKFSPKDSPIYSPDRCDGGGSVFKNNKDYDRIKKLSK
jgi:hypothetical protein